MLLRSPWPLLLPIQPPCAAETVFRPAALCTRTGLNRTSASRSGRVLPNLVWLRRCSV